MSDQNFVDGVDLALVPKVSLHDHLDGALRASTIVDLAQQRGIELPESEPRALQQWFESASKSGSLPEYLETFAVTISVMQTAEELRRVAKEYVVDLSEDGVIYGEVRWAPEQHQREGLTLDEAVTAVQEGIDQGVNLVRSHGRRMQVNQILSAMRQDDRALEIADLALRFRYSGVVGFDIAGPEEGFPAARLQDAFDLIARAHFPATVHAGEGAGIESVQDALFSGRARRLGHGTRVAEDISISSVDDDSTYVQLGEIAEWVKDRQIPLEISPVSNVHTGTIAQWGDDIADHPFDLLYQLGFAVTVNTDNRLMSGTSLTNELGELADAFAYDLDDIETFQLNAVAAAFLPVEEREDLADAISDGFEDLR
ncbi:adenosine deaminase [Humidisolicoccus flavus]|uniref:adenosine deaminase n=1 Tax=Humidisolicoccus flavus TaxID=3111414 RepID=UPI0032556495